MKNYFYECMDCKDRYRGCHAKCEKYIEARKKKDKENADIQTSKATDVMFNSFLSERRERYEKVIRNNSRKKRGV